MNLTTSIELANIALMKSSLLTCVICVINFFALITYIFYNNNISIKNLGTVYEISSKFQKKNYPNIFTQAISFLKEVYLIIFDFSLVYLLSRQTNKIFNGNLKFLLFISIFFIAIRFKELFKAKEFVESQVLKKELENDNLISSSVLLFSYLLIPTVLIGYTLMNLNLQPNSLAKGFLLGATIILSLMKLINILFPESVWSSEKFYGLILEYSAYAFITGWLWLSPILYNSLLSLYDNKLFIINYLIVIILFIILIIKNLFSKNRDK